MLQQMLRAIENDNGVPQDIWAHIMAVMGDHNIGSVQSFGGRYYLLPYQKQKLREMLPFMSGVNLDRIGGGTLALPAHEPEPDWDCEKCGFVVNRISDGAFMAYVCRNEQCSYHDIKVRYTLERVLRCGRCKGPFHPATGHQFNADTVACGVCYGKFAAWQLATKFGHTFLTNKQKKRIDNKLLKQKQKAEKAAKALEKQKQAYLLAQAMEHDKIYGKPRDAQAANDVAIVLGAEVSQVTIPMPIWVR